MLKRIITIIFAAILAALCVHIYCRIFYTAGSNAITISVFIFLAPVILATIIYALRRKSFHLAYWVCATVLILLFDLFLFFAFMRPAVKRVIPDQEDVDNYFRAESGLFTRFYSLYNAYEYPETYYPRAYIAKSVYRIGGPESKQYFIGKILVEVNGKVIKEFYNQPALQDTTLLRTEFGRSIQDLTMIVPLKKR